MRRSVLAVLLTLTAAAPAAAQELRAPAGWSAKAENENLAVVSPADGQGRRVVYLLRRVETVSGNAENWFRRTVAGLAAQHRLILNGRVEREGTLLKIAHVVRTKDGAELSYNAYAYAAGGGQQLILLFYPDSLDASDPRVGTALGEILALWKRGYAYTGEPERKPEVGPHGIVPKGFEGTPPDQPAPPQSPPPKG